MGCSDDNTSNITEVTGVASSAAVPIVVINGLAIIIGVFGNALVIFTITTNKSFHNVYYALVAHLAVADLFICLVDLPIISGIVIAPLSIITTPFLCYLANFCQSAFYPISIMTLIAIALGRYVRITKSRPTYDRIFSARKVGVALAIMWTVIIFYCAMIFSFFMVNAPYTCGRTVCYIDVQDPSNRAIFALINSTSLFVCLVTTPICYVLIFRAVRKSKRRLHPADEPPNETGKNVETISRPTDLYHSTARRRKQLSPAEVRLTKMSAAIFFLNLSMNTPYLIANTVVDIGNEYGVFLVTIWFFAMSSMVNPIVYGVLNKTLRKEMKKLFGFR